MNLCESGRLTQSVDVLVKAWFRRTCCAFFVHLRAFVVSLCCSQFLLALVTWTDDPHRLSQITCHFIVHPCSRIVEHIVDVPVLQNSGTHCHWISSRINCAIMLLFKTCQTAGAGARDEVAQPDEDVPNVEGAGEGWCPNDMAGPGDEPPGVKWKC